MPHLALAFLLTACAAIPGAAFACDDPQEIPRAIVALYDGHRETSPRATRIHRYAEMPLNYLGYRLVYADVSDGPAQLPELPLAATISWFDAPVAAPEALAAWRAGLSDSCGHVPAPIVLGHTGLSDSVLLAESGRAYLSRVGLIREEGDIAVGAFTEMQVRDAKIVGAETALDIRPGTYSTIRAADSATSRLSLTSGDARTDLLVLAPAAAYVHDSALVRYDPRGGALWVSDPFALFGHALGSRIWPVPDTTTLSGRRMFFVTVDADGWLTPLPARQFGDRPPLSSEVLESEIITPYPDTPMSVALLVGDLDPQIGGPVAARGQQVAARIMQLPNVQPATSGVSMIRDWSFFAAYDRQAEEATLTSGAARRNSGAIVAFAVQNLENAFADAAASALDITPNAPRKYASVAFDLVAETAGAIETIAALAPSGAEPPLFSWSGDAMALPGAIAAVTGKGSANMGGGGGFATLTAPSLTNLWPLGIETEGGLQVYDALSGDSHYTAFWTGNLSGFQALAQTLARTETPRRLKPFHLSFAARSATHFATRMAVIDNLELARAADVAPVPAARYAAAVAGFTRYRAIREGDLAWRIEDRGALNTVRFDNAQSLSLDAAASDGVLGARRHADQLYVALDPSFANPLVVLAEVDAPSGIVAAGPEASLVDVRAEILAVAHEDCTLRTTMRGYGEAESTWIGTPGASYEFTLYEQDGTTRLYWEQIVADEDGLVVASLPLPPGLASPVSIATPCSGG